VPFPGRTGLLCPTDNERCYHDEEQHLEYVYSRECCYPAGLKRDPDVGYEEYSKRECDPIAIRHLNGLWVTRREPIGVCVLLSLRQTKYATNHSVNTTLRYITSIIDV
jgi:hypothetical protein